MNSTVQIGDLSVVGIDNIVLLLGALIGVIGSLSVLAIRLQLRKRRLRKALREEIKTMSTDIYRYAESVSQKEPEGIEIPPDTFVLIVYKSSTSDLGFLSSSEVQEVTRFYTLTQNLKQRLANLREIDDPPVHELRLVQRDIIRLNNRKNDVLSSLESNIWRIESVVQSESKIYTDISEPDYDPIDFLNSQLKDTEGPSERQS